MPVHSLLAVGLLVLVSKFLSARHCFRPTHSVPELQIWQAKFGEFATTHLHDRCDAYQVHQLLQIFPVVLKVPHHVVRPPHEQADDNFAEVPGEKGAVGPIGANVREE